MPETTPIFTRETFQFFHDLGRNNKKTWMDAHRDRYRACVVQPFRNFLEAMAPAVLRLDSRFDATGRRGVNFSRINRDIRFAKDKTLYKTQMYLKFEVPFPAGGETGQLYAGISANEVTAGFRIYMGAKRKESALAIIAAEKFAARPNWLAQQKKRLSRNYESYWYSTVKGEWTKNGGWPSQKDQPKLRAWIVRKKLSPAAAMRGTFPQELSNIFRDVYPLLAFTSCAD